MPDSVFVAFPYMGPRHKYTGKLFSNTHRIDKYMHPTPGDNNMNETINGSALDTGSLDWTLSLQATVDVSTMLVSYTVTFFDFRGIHRTRTVEGLVPEDFQLNIEKDVRFVSNDIKEANVIQFYVVTDA